MEHESFENEAVAAIMNEHFVNIKVDREERPDVDKARQLPRRAGSLPRSATPGCAAVRLEHRASRPVICLFM